MSDAIEFARPFIEKSMKRSPCGHTVEEVIEEVLQDRARLWLGEQSATVSQFVSTARVSADERIWHCGGSLEDVIATIEKAAEIMREVGIERLVIEDTRPGWAKVLGKYGFKPTQALVKEL